MSPMTLTNYQSLSLLDQWYEAMRLNLTGESASLKEAVDDRLNHYRSKPDLMLHYTLLQYRYFIMTQDQATAKETLRKVEPFKEDLSPKLLYYYNFFQAVYHWQFGQYQEALDSFTETRQLLDEITDEMEIAEHNYRLAAVYYGLRKSLLSIHYGNQAKDLFSKEPRFQCKWADCENLLGVNCITLKQYEEAEEHLLYALELAKESGDKELILLVKYNLGYLYSEQNLSPIAIRYLNELYEKKFYFPKTLFLYSRELMRVDQKDKANAIINEGLASCVESNNTEYRYHLQLTKAFYSDEPISLTEDAINEGIQYFKSEELWHFVQEYSDQLGRLFFEDKNHQKASEYFYLGHLAKEKLFLMDALK